MDKKNPLKNRGGKKNSPQKDTICLAPHLTKSSTILLAEQGDQGKETIFIMIWNATNGRYKHMKSKLREIWSVITVLKQK